MGFLRLYLALAVAVVHCEGKLFGTIPFLSATWAVQAFYMLSGFTMGMVLEQKYRSSYKKFLFNRITRLYPVYLIVMALTAVLLLYAHAAQLKAIYTLDHYQRIWGSLGSCGRSMVVASNLLLEGKELLAFFRFEPGHWCDLKFWPFPGSSKELARPFDLFLLPQAWTLGIEFTFYVLAPFFAVCKNWLLLAFIALSLGLRLFGYAIGLDQGVWINGFFPSELFFFLMGMLGWRLCDSAMLGKGARSAMAVVGVVMIAWTLHRAPGTQAKDLTGVTLALWLFFVLPFLDAWGRNNPLDRYWGKWAYPVYMTHLLAIQLLYYFGGVTPQKWVATVIVLSLVLSWPLVHLVDLPVERWRARVSARWAWLQ